MPRNQNSGNLALRNRNRVTNKTRLKVIRENIEADPIGLDEDEERARIVSTAGVDAEDANEHHLQAVLSAASHRNSTTLLQRSTRAAEKATKPNDPPAAFIPVPNAAGVADNSEELYPANKWSEPHTYVKFSAGVEECVHYGLADSNSYFMDERDKDWLDKNNQEARGEGTSAQAAASSAGSTTRTSRGTRSKGKEAEGNNPVHISEDLFELLMGIFEKVTNDTTPFLHVSLQQGMGVPPFGNYEEVLQNELPASTFANFSVPPDLPTPSVLLKVARIIYPHWRDRRTERGGHRIIPTLNFDETDQRNESYICFRRREIKAVRKTRATQASSTDKLQRLKGELASSLELARNVLLRERQKKESILEAQHVWEKRTAFVDLKRKLPALGVKEDEELLFDKERVPKKPRVETSVSQTIKFRSRLNVDTTASPVQTEAPMRPKDRVNMIHGAIEDHLKRQKERDHHHWDDQIDNPYQPDLIPYSDRLFKAIPSVARPATEQGARAPRHIRLRYGRGGRIHLDRRLAVQPKKVAEDYLALEWQTHDPSERPEVMENARRIAERWRYDLDYQPAVVDGAADEVDRMLLDDFQPRYLRHSIQLLQEQDHQAYLVTDARLIFSDGHKGFTTVAPFRAVQPGLQRPPVVGIPQAPHQQHINGATPVAMQTPVRKGPPNSMQQRAPSNGPYRLSSTPAASSSQVPTAVPSVNANVYLNPNGNAASVQGNGGPNGTAKPAGTPAPDVPMVLDPPPPRAPDPIPQAKPQNTVQTPSPAPPAVNGFTANGTTHSPMETSPIASNTLTNGLSSTYPSHPAAPHRVLTPQQAQSLKAALSSNQGAPLQSTLPPNSSIPLRPPQTNYSQHLVNGINGNNFSLMGTMNLKLPPGNQWAAGTQRSNPGPNSVVDLTPNLGIIRASSANGHHASSPLRVGQSPPNILPAQERSSPVSHHLVAHVQQHPNRSPSLPHLSPPRLMATSLPSPSLPQQQVLNQGTGY